MGGIHAGLDQARWPALLVLSAGTLFRVAALQPGSSGGNPQHMRLVLPVTAQLCVLSLGPAFTWRAVGGGSVNGTLSPCGDGWPQVNSMGGQASSVFGAGITPVVCFRFQSTAVCRAVPTHVWLCFPAQSPAHLCVHHEGV